ncbi:hypothetical protein HanRHA438_Chr05g0214771 [Helianthus annuus]|nr:hypothetical protein HanHA300_Chr05g0168331 [Helianthus annuus]KAJ0583929.1 hypothetical protein HanHA89_Chr05g0182381 [Helianthus annuus]KAJ0918183.1 hypothetical protein HanRHA438_Chr05g0214771 [Helianthus annuus]
MLRESNNQLMDPFCRGCAGPHKYEDCPVAFQGAMPSDSKETPLEDTESTNENDKVEREEREEKNGKFIIDFSCGDEKIDAQLAEYKRLTEEEIEEEPPGDLELSDVEPETIMDVEVPPQVQQVVNSSYWCPTPWNIDDGFWSDDEVVVEEAELEVPDYTAVEEVENELLNKMEDEKGEHVPSWEEEFGDELVGLPTLEDEEFDPVGDLAYLETLLEKEPTMEIKYTPNVEEKVAAGFDNWPVKDLDVVSPSYLKSREKAHKRLD